MNTEPPTACFANGESFATARLSQSLPANDRSSFPRERNPLHTATHPVLHVKGRIVHDLIGLEFGAACLEFVGDELEEEQAEYEVLVFRRFHTAPQQVRGIPDGLYETLLGLLGAAFFFAILVPVADSGW